MPLAREQAKLVTSYVGFELVRMNNEAKSLIECLTEAAECDRLAGLARTETARRVMTLCATAWRRRAEDAKREIAPGVRKSN